MATFNNLYFAGDAFRTAIVAKVQVGGIPAVTIGAVKPQAGTAPLVNVVLLMINEEATHKNDPPFKNPDGTLAAPPTTLSATVAVLTEGTSGQGDLADAHQYLGEIVRTFHDEPFLDMQALGYATAQAEGRLHVGMVPMTPDLMEKVFTPLQAQHRPFAVFELWPIQLRTTVPLGDPSAVVRPGGVTVGGPTPISSPAIERVYPKRAAIGRFLRIDGRFTQPVDAVVVGTRVLTGASLLPVPGVGLDRAVRVLLDGAMFGTGRHRVHVLAPGNLASNEEEILIDPDTAPALDAPNVASYAQSAPPLVLSGAGLGLATRVFFWPDAGIAHPSDVHDFPAVALPNQVTTTPTNLAPGVYRVSAEITPGPGIPLQFTPYVVLEVSA